jgi:cytochrome c oxidase subunit II
LTRGARRYLRPVALVAALVLPPVAACTEESPSILTPSGPSAQRVEALWWFMFAVSAVVVGFVTTLLLIGALRRRRRVDEREEPRWARGLLVGGGIVAPVVVLAVLWALTLRDVAETSSPPGEPTVRIEVDGKRWWWDVRYPELGVVTANEIHVPVGETVQLLLTSDDIIHSFWVPELAGKTDMIPGRTNQMWIRADRPGVYRGQCAEFCGLQHAHMAFLVIADPPEVFDEWVASQQAVPTEPTDPTVARGREVFMQSACIGCHTIQGTEATGTLGPDLTHLASRRTLGAATIPNTGSNLRAWVPNAPSFKPGVLMPPIPLTTDQLDALVAYLESLE